MFFLGRRCSSTIPPVNGRVVILGASRGIGRVLALKYALVGARVCIVALREEELANVADECRVAAKTRSTTDYYPIFSIKGDFTVTEDMISVRDRVRSRESQSIPLVENQATDDIWCRMERIRYSCCLCRIANLLTLLRVYWRRDL